MDKAQAIKCFTEGTKVWYYNRTTTFAHKTIQGIEDKVCWMWDYSGSLKIPVPFAELGMTEMEAKEIHYNHRIVDGPSDVARHAEHFGMVVLTDDQYNQIIDIQSAILDDADNDGPLIDLPRILGRIRDLYGVVNYICNTLNIVGGSMINRLEAIREEVTNGQYLLPTPKPRLRPRPVVGEKWSVLGDQCVIVDIDGIKAVNIETGMFWDCDDETFIEHCIFEE